MDWATWWRVYPRGCGGTEFWRDLFPTVEGLSPRVRGNPSVISVPRGTTRSIPAGAGEPLASLRPGLRRRVYPRGCGGTPLTALLITSATGLSPRVRGNHERRVHLAALDRSIPAGAGEPLPRGGARGAEQVYPRGCGGTTLALSSSLGLPGLSPRVRGNQAPALRRVVVARSIPAGAGEPPGSGGRKSRCGVYPRGCGGTAWVATSVFTSWGLSPRVRGNPLKCVHSCVMRGSIPAGAGEPLPLTSVRTDTTVYPRGCGGTTSARWTTCTLRGLSPRVRGNRVLAAQLVNCTGSIPAGAGEPLDRRGRAGHGKVYPRGCGGTRR